MAGKGKMKRRHFRSSKIGGYEAEMPNVRGGGREPALDAGTKKGEGEMERAMTSPGVYGKVPFWADDDIVLKKKKAFIAHQCAMHKRYLVRGDSPEKWTDAARRKRGWRELKRMERGSALLPSGRVQAEDGNTRPDVLISSSGGTHPPDSSS